MLPKRPQGTVAPNSVHGRVQLELSNTAVWPYWYSSLEEGGGGLRFG